MAENGCYRGQSCRLPSAFAGRVTDPGQTISAFRGKVTPLRVLDLVSDQPISVSARQWIGATKPDHEFRMLKIRRTQPNRADGRSLRRLDRSIPFESCRRVLPKQNSSPNACRGEGPGWAGRATRSSLSWIGNSRRTSYRQKPPIWPTRPAAGSTGPAMRSDSAEFGSLLKSPSRSAFCGMAN